MRLSVASSILLAAGAVASSAPPSSTRPLHPRQSSSECAAVQILGAREAGADPGYGAIEPFVELLLDTLPDAAAEPLRYPAVGGEDYDRGVTAGIRAFVNYTEEIHERCPDSKLIFTGYSTGAQVIDDVVCGGPDPPSLVTDIVVLDPEIGKKVAAIIWMGNPRFIGGLPYNVGSAELGGFAAREEGFVCKTYSDRIRSYCDEGDPYCSQGNSDLTHGSYPAKYGSAALKFVQEKLGINTTTGEYIDVLDETQKPSGGNWVSRPSYGVGLLAVGTTAMLLLS
ncbi:carbohydrate esterase family 5 protein [Sodiomyces alcalophilus JCM 7366]|uniref:carbohydrate esterase family 5 protein n=1 Tax=Sodiomyces alcalophilus JCM 7366 TaxID=591952 RepID=UPI0039B6AD7F